MREAVGAGRGATGWLRHALDRLVPPACVACGAGLPPRATPLCELCRHRLPAVAPPWCGRCGATRPGGPAPCPECADWPEDLRSAAAPCRMAGVAARLVHALKYEGWTALAGPMGREMAAVAPRVVRAAGAPVLVPVPLSAARTRERGFNQAALLAGAVSRRTGWPVRELLVRERTGKRQARLGRSARGRNVQGLFRVAAGAGPPPGGGPHDGAVASRAGPATAVGATRPSVGRGAGGVGSAAGAPILVDDVLTTGATAAACAGALTRAGMAPAGVIVFARASRVLGAD